MFTISSPKEIYAAVLAEVDKLIQSFGGHSESEEIEKAQSEAREQMNALRQGLNDSLNQLEKNSEWDVFTVAFYGETNAGKSTLIETLRILLNEQGKAKEREEFEKALAEYCKFQKELEVCQSNIDSIVSDYEGKFAGIENQLLEISAKLDKVEDRIKFVQDEAKELVSGIKNEKSSSFVKFVKYVFGKLPKQQELKKTRKVFYGLKSEKDECIKKQSGINQKKNSLCLERDEKINKFEIERAELLERVKPCTEKLIANADGKIIGDGRLDFTRTVANYEFEANNQKFALLDLPGIEGNETNVLDDINSAVQKAHAVFYITPQPKPPQTGDKNSVGTIDKIKKHLGQQTEVYTVFNKRVKNPNSLKDMLIDSDETESLKVLDKTMHSYLGEQYRETISISAYPAFLAVGNLWGDYLPKKEKFLEHFKTSEAILDKTGIKIFGERLVSDILNNSKEKIKKSNFNKAAVVLEYVTEETGKIHRTFFEFQQKITELKTLTDGQLDNAAEDLNAGLDREAHTAIEKFKNDVRKKIYEDIDTDISNDEFKSALERKSKEGIENLRSCLEKSFKDQIDKFQEDVSGIAEKYQDNTSELLNIYISTGKFDVKLVDIDIKSGINWGGTMLSVVGSIAGIVIAGFFGIVPGIVLAVIGAIISLGKAIAGFFNHDYRKSQQRKNADASLEKSGEKIYEAIKKKLKEYHEPLQIGIVNIKDELTKTVDHVKEINRILENAILEFKNMAKAIIQEGGQ